MTRKRHRLTDRARDMRNDPTKAEYKLWGALRANQLAGIKFRRQAPIGDYIVDFVTFEHQLVIELDGEQHAEQQEYDQRRTRWLESQGFREIRFWNFEVFENFDGVMAAIAVALGLEV